MGRETVEMSGWTRTRCSQIRRPSALRRAHSRSRSRRTACDPGGPELGATGSSGDNQRGKAIKSHKVAFAPPAPPLTSSSSAVMSISKIHARQVRRPPPASQRAQRGLTRCTRSSTPVATPRSRSTSTPRRVRRTRRAGGFATDAFFRSLPCCRALWCLHRYPRGR